MKEGAVYETLRRLARRLAEDGLDYAIVGGMAVAEHGYLRTTRDVDVLMRAETLEAFRQRWVGRGYAPAFSGSRRAFRDVETGGRIEVVVTGEYPGDGRPKPVAFPDPARVAVEVEGIRFIGLEPLIELKLASGMSAAHRLQDLADVQNLILELGLPLDVEERLDPSVRPEYRRLWEAAQGAPPAG